ncbi:hypothetical protein TL16_g10999 [Triparma laevis f. inornata]|uniref:Uncharacterized protein n=2 Tax=Triparma laevis TaxID=1534972 RepID=A0A9W7E8J9_9STRA|nr:hypothetical protein TrLO_g8926 [Triparma laevis f. longispina]GMH87903.1 hypothetical protein TL16_g10999 [Triparma laevis f. inornata]
MSDHKTHTTHKPHGGLARQSTNLIEKSATFNNISEKKSSRKDKRSNFLSLGFFGEGNPSRALFNQTKNILVIGCKNAGKSLLLRNISRTCEVRTMRKLNKHQNTINSLPALTIQTVPTIGVENATCTFDNQPLAFREVGSQLSPMWPSYFEQSSTIVFVLDVSNCSKISGPATEIQSMFHNLMSGQSGKPKGVAIVLNKSDVASAEDVEKVTGFLRVKELCEEYSKHYNVPKNQHLAIVLEISSSTGYNIQELLTWLS